MLESIRATAINDGWAGQDRRHHYDWNPVFYDEYVRSFTAVYAASKGLRQEYRLMKAVGLMPEQDRERWQLGRSYPMASNYAATRAQLASTTGLGRMQKAAGES
ncbi:MucR family transcriptional regulator [Phyllobacterium sp. LjRoot231]|uniref:MucR family transcriptional regulator n=1 Tax=Phyllobacterium sp. LjRoot231 TaxID=3342289 RepID=UPI003F50B1B8